MSVRCWKFSFKCEQEYDEYLMVEAEAVEMEQILARSFPNDVSDTLGEHQRREAIKILCSKYL